MSLIVGQGVVDWVAEKVGGKFYAATGIGWERGPIVAGVVYDDFNGPNVFAHIALDGPMAREFLWTIFDYPFNQLRVKRITCPIGEGNVKARRLCCRLGFRQEAKLDDAHPTGALYLYRLRREQCRFLDMKRLYAPPRERMAA